MLKEVKDQQGLIIKLEESEFIKRYKEQLKNKVRLINKEISEEDLNSIIDKKINEKISLEKQVSEKDNHENIHETNMLSVMDYILLEKPIITGYATAYKQHQDAFNILLKMVEMLLDTRTIYKRKKLECANDEDKTLYNLYDNYQLTYKLLNNSFFGVSGQPQSIFFDPNFPSSILYTGQIIIMTAITAFEMINGNFYFNKTDDALLFIERILNQEYVLLNKDLFIDKHATVNMVKNRIYSLFENNKFDKNIIESVINKLNQDELDKVYYKNNLLEFIGNSQIKDLLENIIDGSLSSGDKPFLDPNKPSNTINGYLEEYWKYVKEICVYSYIPLNRVEFCHSHIRKTVLVVDTDSNFLYNRPYTDKLRAFFHDKLDKYEEIMEQKMTCINISMYTFTKLVASAYDHMGRVLNVDDEHRPIIRMKNE